MLGTIVNVLCVLLGGGIGCLLRKGLPDRIKETVIQGLGLCVVLIGVQGALKTENVMILILSVALGGTLGALCNIEKRLDALGEGLQKRFSGGENTSFGRGFVTASLMFCVGAMTVVGSMEAGLRGDCSTLYVKSLLDLITSLILASMLGPGVLLAAGTVLVYQGALTLLAGVLSPVLTEAAVREMSAVGGTLIVGVGLNMIRRQHIPVGNLLPAIFLPILLTLFM